MATQFNYTVVLDLFRSLQILYWKLRECLNEGEIRVPKAKLHYNLAETISSFSVFFVEINEAI